MDLIVTLNITIMRVSILEKNVTLLKGFEQTYDLAQMNWFYKRSWLPEVFTVMLHSFTVIKLSHVML